MQRQTLVPLSNHFRRSRPARAGAPKILEVACGTGRFATFLKVGCLRIAVSFYKMMKAAVPEDPGDLDCDSGRSAVQVF